MTREHIRLQAAREQQAAWKKWGPYLSERQWGTVREDYSDNGDAWNYLSHEQSRSRAYHWGEDGLAGLSDDHGVLCFAMALWNGKDPILKERLFGLANSEGNHGEDVKEYYFYLDSTPTHSYMKYLYKYPQAEFPYQKLIETNRSRGKNEAEYELLDTGVFDEDRYFDVFVEYAKESPEEILIKITVCNRGPEPAVCHVLPHLWFCNTWSWMGGGSRPELHQIDDASASIVHAKHTDPLFQESLPEYYLYAEGKPPLLFTENETNNARLYAGKNATLHVKDGIHDYIVHEQTDAVATESGTKVAAHYPLTVPAEGEQVVRLRLSRQTPDELARPFTTFDQVMTTRIQEADEFYAKITPADVRTDIDRTRVMRQALAGMLWSKQHFYFDLQTWLKEHQGGPETPPSKRRSVRNANWYHMFNDDVISMPDKWEYPWYAAWDLAFHTIALGMVDPVFAKDQLRLMLSNDYQHPNGQIPAYEWNFGDVNPPVHAWATMQLYLFDKTANKGKGDREFLEFAFNKLLANFTWWVNRKDRAGNNCFDGGFLGLDNIGVFDRSSPLPTGGYLDQADGTAWMAFFAQQMMRISVELALDDPLYEEFVQKFFEHTVYISGAMDSIGINQDEMWDEDDGFYYDLLRFPDGSATRLKVRSMVGLLPLAATAVFEDDVLTRLPNFAKRAEAFIRRNPELCQNIHLPALQGHTGRRMVSIVNEAKLRRILARMLDENEFFSPNGIRALSRCHLDHPYIFNLGGQEFRVGYVPGDSDSGMFGGNSNWRGPVWMPVNFLLYTSLHRLYAYYGDDFEVECPTGSGKMATLFEVAQELGERLERIFLRDSQGRRPVYGRTEKFQQDPHWRDLISFFEYFHGDNGTGIGASHQTGWTGLIARVIQLQGTLSPDVVLTRGAQEKILQQMHGT
jgi:hypothetical protein